MIFSAKVWLILKYTVNGVIATAAHFTTLYIIIEQLQFKFAGLANFIGALFGIFSSFIGNRYWVFNSAYSSFLIQGLKFAILYLLLATLSGLTLFIWTDYLGLDYKVGFLISTFAQFILSYFGNKTFIFKHETK